VTDQQVKCWDCDEPIVTGQETHRVATADGQIHQVACAPKRPAVILTEAWIQGRIVRLAQ
jgi:hypothetical protein